MTAVDGSGDHSYEDDESEAVSADREAAIRGLRAAYRSVLAERDAAQADLAAAREREEFANYAHDEAERDHEHTAERLRVAREREQTLREALDMLWTHYLLPISDEQKAQVLAVLDAAGEEK